MGMGGGIVVYVRFLLLAGFDDERVRKTPGPSKKERWTPF